MINEDNQNALDFVRASNKDKLYQATLKEVQENKKQVPSYTLDELKISHYKNDHNHMIDREIEKIKLLLRS